MTALKCFLEAALAGALKTLSSHDCNIYDRAEMTSCIARLRSLDSQNVSAMAVRPTSTASARSGN